jgi:hypothetical protein
MHQILVIVLCLAVATIVVLMLTVHLATGWFIDARHTGRRAAAPLELRETVQRARQLARRIATETHQRTPCKLAQKLERDAAELERNALK